MLIIGYVIVIVVDSLFAIGLTLLLIRKVKKSQEFKKQPGFIQVVLQIIAFVSYTITYIILIDGRYAWVSGIFVGIGWSATMTFTSFFVYSM